MRCIVRKASTSWCDDSDEDDRREYKRQQVKKAEAPTKVEEPEPKKKEVNLLDLDAKE